METNLDLHQSPDTLWFRFHSGSVWGLFLHCQAKPPGCGATVMYLAHFYTGQSRHHFVKAIGILKYMYTFKAKPLRSGVATVRWGIMGGWGHRPAAGLTPTELWALWIVSCTEGMPFM